MIRRLPLYLLMLSITFNVFFAGGFLQAQYAGPKPEAREAVSLVADRLGLSEEQKQAFARLREDMAARGRQTREATAAARQELWSHLSSGTAEPHKIRDLMEFEADQNRQLRLQMLDHVRQFMQTLTPGQRAALLKAFQNRGFAVPGGQRRGDRPEATGGGKAADPQRATVRDRFQSRWNEWQHSRQHMFERFDTDGDGKLSDQERAEAMKSMQEWKANGHTPRQDAK
jgi:Spy/CpxP family protein refolding chaperone